MILSVSEVLEKASKLKSFEEKVAFLQQNTSTALIVILKACFHPDIKFLLPEGDPPYKPSEFHDDHGVLLREYRKMFYLVSGTGYDEMNQIRRERIFIEMLESINRDDAKLLLAVKDKKMPYKTITYRLVETAFPGSLPPKAKSDVKEDEQA